MPDNDDTLQWRPTEEEALAYTRDFLEAVRLYAEDSRGHRDAIVDLLAGPETDDNDEAMKHTIGLFCAGALVAGHAAKDALVGAETPGRMAYGAVDPRTGPEVAPDDMPLTVRCTMAALVGGANVRPDVVVENLAILIREPGLDPVLDGIWTFVCFAAQAGALTP